MTFFLPRFNRSRLPQNARRRRKLVVESLETRRLLASDVMGSDVSRQTAGVEVDTAQLAAEVSPVTGAMSAAGPAHGQLNSEGLRRGEGEPSRSVHFRFVYPSDADPAGFFRKFPHAQELLEQAARQLTDRLADQLNPIHPLPAGVTWAPRYNNPANGTSKAVPAGFKIGANEIVVFVGARNLQSFDPPGSNAVTHAYVRGMEASSFSCSGMNSPTCSAVVEKHLTRGEVLTRANKAVDYAPALGSIAFDTRPATLNHLFFEEGTIEPNQVRFMTLVQHELAHLLGFGLAPSYFSKFSGNHFAGKHAQAVYAGPVPLAPPDGGHLHQSVADAGLSIMGHSINSDSLFKELDFAVLKDIGWEVGADPRPTISLDTPDLVVVENAGAIEITATLSQPAPTKLTFPVSLTGAAAATSDVRLSPPNFVFEANQRTAKITVTIVDDSVNEATESVTISLRESVAAKLGAKTDFELTIFDDDGVQYREVRRIDPSSITDAVEIPGDNRAHGIIFRAAANRTLRITAPDVEQLSEAVLLIDKHQQVIGSYGRQGLLSAPLVAGQSYAVVFYPRSAAQTFTVALPGGFAALTPRTNVLFPQDVNGNGEVTEVDALQIINQLNLAHHDTSVDAATVTGDGFYDVSGDGQLTAVDALQVINYLNDPAKASSEPLASSSGDSDVVGVFPTAATRGNDASSREVAHRHEERRPVPLHDLARQDRAKLVGRTVTTLLRGDAIAVDVVDRAIEAVSHGALVPSVDACPWAATLELEWLDR